MNGGRHVNHRIEHGAPPGVGFSPFSVFSYEPAEGAPPRYTDAVVAVFIPVSLPRSAATRLPFPPVEDGDRGPQRHHCGHENAHLQHEVGEAGLATSSGASALMTIKRRMAATMPTTRNGQELVLQHGPLVWRSSVTMKTRSSPSIRASTWPTKGPSLLWARTGTPRGRTRRFRRAT